MSEQAPHGHGEEWELLHGEERLLATYSELPREVLDRKATYYLGLRQTMQTTAAREATDRVLIHLVFELSWRDGTLTKATPGGDEGGQEPLAGPETTH